jgi:hypothetical protein
LLSLERYGSQMSGHALINLKRSSRGQSISVTLAALSSDCELLLNADLCK